jgi:DNA-binding NarL/FixJ family response regulator
MDFLPMFSDKPKLALIRVFLELTDREWAVLLAVADDEPNAQIADRLCLSARSVQNYRYQIADKLGLKGYRVLERAARHHRANLHEWFNLLNEKELPPPEI